MRNSTQVHADDIGLHAGDASELGRRTEGFVGRDIFNLARRLQVKMLQGRITERGKSSPGYFGRRLLFQSLNSVPLIRRKPG